MRIRFLRHIGDDDFWIVANVEWQADGRMGVRTDEGRGHTLGPDDVWEVVGPDTPEVPPHQRYHETSVAMAHSSATTFRGRQRQIAEYVQPFGMDGRTCYEIEDALDLTHQSASGALRVLERKDVLWVPRLVGGGLARPAYLDDPRPRLKRPNQFGNDAQVYVHMLHSPTVVTLHV